MPHATASWARSRVSHALPGRPGLARKESRPLCVCIHGGARGLARSRIGAASGVSSEAPGAAPTSPSTPVAIASTIGSATALGPSPGSAVGQQLVLDLGMTYQWTVRVDGSGVLAPASVPLQAGQQGAWMAERAGTAQIPGDRQTRSACR